MELGSFALAWASVPLVLSMVGYFLVAVGVREFRLSARVIYWIMFALAFAAFLDLFRLFITDQFHFAYVASYSSSDLPNSWPHFFKISALWAGQQGTFLLWLVFGLGLGFWVKAKAREQEGWVMFFYILGQTFLLVLTIISNPFERLDFIPVDGQGLNPLLQNYWMQIHPPIVFMGFAAACIPFAFAMAALATNKYDDWVKRTMPWVVFTVATLGLGIFLGGYWAYETLGWGGYWAWDPVENSSLIPWLVSIALVHGMVVEKSRGTWRRTNLFLAVTLFLLIIYGTFLTRSGVLADFSVHSFVDLGYNNILWGSIVVMGLISYGMWAYRASKMKVPSQSGTGIFSQEFTTFLAMVLLLPFTLLVLFWTSFPLITSIMSGIPLLSRIAPTPAAIQPLNYNVAGLIFSVIFSIVLGANALLSWKDTDTAVLKRKLIVPISIALAASIIFIVFGFSKISESWSSDGGGGAIVFVMSALYFLFFATAVFSLTTNVLFMIKRWKTNFLASGGYLTHFGFSLMLIGVILSSGFGDSAKITVVEGDSNSALGYTVNFTGTEQTKPKEKKSNFELSDGDNIIQASSTSKEMQRGQQLQYVRTPYIEKFFLYDLYLSVENLVEPGGQNSMHLDLKSGESMPLAGMTLQFDGYDSDSRARELARAQGKRFELTKGQAVTVDDARVTFQEFDMSQHQEGMGSGIGARLKIDYDGRSSTVVPFFNPSQAAPEPVAMPTGGYVSLTKIRADAGSVVLLFQKEKTAPDIQVGTVINVITDNDTSTVVPIFNPSVADYDRTAVTLNDGSRLAVVSLDVNNNMAHFDLTPPHRPGMATVALSTKPMINLVWLGFLMIVVGAVIAVVRRMGEARRRNN